MTGSHLPSLSEDERQALLRLARDAVIARVAGRPAPEVARLSPRLQAPQGAFVSLLLRGDLRGCIGMVEAIRPLADTVVHCAAAAATEDPRFEALRPAEVPGLTIEITLLGPPFEVHDRSQVILGRHGLMAARGSRRGVLLPQVATQNGFDLTRFIRETLKKAELPPDALERGDASLSAFEGEMIVGNPPETTGPAPDSPPRSREPPG